MKKRKRKKNADHLVEYGSFLFTMKIPDETINHVYRVYYIIRSSTFFFFFSFLFAFYCCTCYM